VLDDRACDVARQRGNHETLIHEIEVFAMILEGFGRAYHGEAAWACIFAARVAAVAGDAAAATMDFIQRSLNPSHNG
jgi:hypothetical protein